MNPIACLEPEISRGDKDLFTPLHSADQHLDAELVPQSEQGLAAEGTAFIQLDLYQLCAAPAKGLDVRRRGKAEDPGDLDGSGQLRINGQAQTQFVF